jgi:acyl-CoA reductase-like NAD-dependent aldehyde dehydrogenase
MVPMEGGPAGAGKLGFVLRVPIGVVGAISPFNFPLNLVAHKLGPALAAGCPVVLKPASATPLSAIDLVELLIEAGVPADFLHVVAGPGAQTGDPLVDSDDVAAISFTGSVPVGWAIRSRAPKKQVMLELGNNAPLIVNSDGDWQTAADKAAIHGYSHAGQSCISTQRLILHEDIAEGFIDRFKEKVLALKVGDPLDPATDVGPLIDSGECARVKSWIDSAKAGGATVLVGGEINPDGTLQPTIIDGGSDSDDVWKGEAFGPLTVIRRFSKFSGAIELANASDYGLQAGVFTSDIGTALEAARSLEYGGVLVNEVPTFRTDQQPYGGVKDSGNTKEGPHYSVREFTEERLVTLQP